MAAGTYSSQACHRLPWLSQSSLCLLSVCKNPKPALAVAVKTLAISSFLENISNLYLKGASQVLRTIALKFSKSDWSMKVILKMCLPIKEREENQPGPAACSLLVCQKHYRSCSESLIHCPVGSKGWHPRINMGGIYLHRFGLRWGEGRLDSNVKGPQVCLRKVDGCGLYFYLPRFLFWYSSNPSP